ncbi:hypothetical protein [Flavobacterium chilense]|uniref:MORN repeat variant n=1 Tax=Flavobacterium chilense TaxID=946677 RepID=A0A1M6ZCF2_9FLAO|nr:hypothetical protein [Flavobacterium chilense]SHL28025.1 hypothetical protein SAMN05444484_101961 [Flavobacterium chilense]
MKKLFFIAILFIFYNCNAQIKKENKPIVKVVIPIRNKQACGNDNNISLKKRDYWRANNYYDEKQSYYNLSTAKNILTVKKEYSIKNGFLFFNNKLVDSLEIYFGACNGVFYNVGILKGLPVSQNIIIANNPYPSMYGIQYTPNETIFTFLDYNSTLINGTGNLKKYYYSKWDGKTQNYSKEILKEEGEVKNNFKLGEWKYYNKNGVIDSTKTYTLKDSVDVRFPHCIFNKKEPCYSENKSSNAYTK